MALSDRLPGHYSLQEDDVEYKLGRLPGKIPVGLRELSYYAAGPLPKAPASMPVPEPPGGEWLMLGNDTYGDCGVAGLEHVFMADAAETAETETFPTDAQTVTYYLTYTGGQDTGVVLSDFLNYVRQNGYYDKKILAYAPIAVHDIPTLHTAVFMYDAAYTGIQVTAQMMTDFQDDHPWTMKSLESPVEGGHCVPIVGYDGTYLYIVTWGKIQKIEYSAWHYMSSEAWAIITGELETGDGHGINLDALKADLNRIAN